MGNVFFLFFSCVGTLSEWLFVEHLEAAVGHQCLRYADSLRCLIVFYDGCNDARKCQCRTVEGMAQFYLLVVGSAVAAFQPVGLVCVKVADGRNLQPTLLCFGVDFKVIADGGCERLVAAAEQQDTIGELQFLQQAFDMLQHLFMALL